MDVLDFIQLIVFYNSYKMYHKMQAFIEYIHSDPKLDMKWNYYFIKGIFPVLRFENEDDRNKVKSILRI